MTFAESVFYYWSDKEWDSCDKFRDAAEKVLNPKNITGMLEWSASDTQVFIQGTQNTSQSLINMLTGEVHGKPSPELLFNRKAQTAWSSTACQPIIVRFLLCSLPAMSSWDNVMLHITSLIPIRGTAAA